MNSLLLKLLVNPSLAPQLDDSEWDLVLIRARECELLGRVYSLVIEQRCYSLLPDFVRRQLDSVAVQLNAQRRVVRYETNNIAKILSVEGITCIFLKGAAYLLSNTPNAQGRLFSDIDILVPENRLQDVEELLRDHGWVSSHANAYDQNYYRRWMHELPPMMHVSRRTVLDVHHNILPRSMASHPDAELLIANSVVTGDGYLTLSTIDMLLHSVVHLFHEGEVRQGLRGLVDVDLLFRRLSESQQSRDLWCRAEQLNQLRSLCYGLYFSQKYLNTPLPKELEYKLNEQMSNLFWRKLMSSLYAPVFDDEANHFRSARVRFYEWLLYVRSHYLRMPLHRLIRHLLVKGMMSSESR